MSHAGACAGACTQQDNRWWHRLACSLLQRESVVVYYCRETVLFIGARFSNLYTAVDTPYLIQNSALSAQFCVRYDVQAHSLVQNCADDSGGHVPL